MDVGKGIDIDIRLRDVLGCSSCSTCAYICNCVCMCVCVYTLISIHDVCMYVCNVM